jgi:hypothetical protein
MSSHIPGQGIGIEHAQAKEQIATSLLAKGEIFQSQSRSGLPCAVRSLIVGDPELAELHLELMPLRWSVEKHVCSAA